VVLVILAIASAATRSTGIGALVTLASLFVAALTWEWTGLGTGWGVEEMATLAVLGAGIPLVLWQRHWADAIARLSARARR
jgi:hypothetical protein